ncbi:MAG: nicotinamide riboside transporter PnuC, partial [Ruminococcus sp.]|nr:nicotinamide riboside transporter PnuC [Ruminococcus sp.]
MNILKSFKELSKFELSLWITSVIVVTISFFVSSDFNILTLIASLIGVTALIFIAKGNVLGQILTVVFSIIYAIISLQFRYFGEAITYMGMTMPIAIMSVISWIRNPFEEGKSEVKVERLSKKKAILMVVLTMLITLIFYYILKFFNTNSLIFSTISITTSFLASFLMLNRNPLYALAYACNDIVLIV